MAVVCFIVMQLSCTQSYSPPATQGNNNFLVVDGFINSGPDSTIFNLSHSVNLGDSLTAPPETGAKFFVQGNGGFSMQLTDLGNGSYGAPISNLDPAQQFRISINTVNGNQYISDYVPVLQTPPIDSISWQQANGGVQISVTTHDPKNLVNYYRWQFTSTWEYHALYFAILIYNNGMVIQRTPDQYTYTCWNSANSSDILVGSSAKLSQGIIYEQPLNFIAQPSVELSAEYSILVKQFALTQDAYNFWETLKTNTEELGTLFGPQPSEVGGNIHCINQPTLPVLGYVSAGNLQQQRIFIDNTQLNNWGYSMSCPDSLIAVNAYYPHWYNMDYAPVQYFNGIEFMTIAPTPCTDCRTGGGDTSEPSFWH